MQDHDQIIHGRESWEVPSYQVSRLTEKKTKYCIVIPVINEGSRIGSLLRRMTVLKISQQADIIIVDGGSSDDSLNFKTLEDNNVSTVLVKTGPGKLSAQLRCAYAFALDKGYDGIVTIDGNDKDDPVAIPLFIEELEKGADFVQGSRFIGGGFAENTPTSRDFAIRYIHAPVLKYASGFPWTDTTQGFRAYSRKLLLDRDVSIFREVFSTYELLAYLSYRAPRLGFVCKEVGSSRRYPKGEIPTKISVLRGNLSVFKILINACRGRYNPPHVT